MSDPKLLTAFQVAEVDAELERARLTHPAILAQWRAERGLPSPMELYVRRLTEKKTARRNAASAKRHASKLRRTPPWADREAINAVYSRARALTDATGIPHHVDHKYPLQGRLVSGLHVAGNLQILTGPENCRKNNRYEVEA